MIMSHCGGTLPLVIDRIGIFGKFLGAPDDQTSLYKKILRERFFFDMAGFPFPEQIHGLLGGERTASKRILYGSDFPYTGAPLIGSLCSDMDREFRKLFYTWQRRDINSGNAKKLFGLSVRKAIGHGIDPEKETYSPSMSRSLKKSFCF